MLRTGLWFGCGLVAMLLAGWAGLPRVLYTHQVQPVEFRHKTHATQSGNAECTACHSVREDGAFTGIPRMENCATCHAEPMGTSPAEATLVRTYAKAGRETPWLGYAREPANVRFSHAIHTTRAGLACSTCHGTQGESDALPVYQQNRISGYSRALLSMSDCEDCHRKRGFETGCLGCHQ